MSSNDTNQGKADKSSSERQGQQDGGQGKRKSRRRPVRRRKNGAAAKGQKKSDNQRQGGEASEKQRINERARHERRRRRKRGRGRQKETGQQEGKAKLEIDYVTPESVFIYTHIARKDQRDAGYEYRPDHFAHTGRQLDDFRIDLSPILGSILEVEEGSSGILKEFIWDDELDEETIYAGPDSAPDTPAADDARS